MRVSPGFYPSVARIGLGILVGFVFARSASGQG